MSRYDHSRLKRAAIGRDAAYHEHDYEFVPIGDRPSADPATPPRLVYCSGVCELRCGGGIQLAPGQQFEVSGTMVRVHGYAGRRRGLHAWSVSVLDGAA